MGDGHDTRRGGAPGSENAQVQPSGLNRREAAEYIAGLLDELRAVADTANLTFLTYLLAMALEEAQAEDPRR